MKKYALFFDIDGTLVSFKTHQIPPSTIFALTQAKANGHKVFIATGRPPLIITNLGAIEHLIDGYVTINGALCFVNDKMVCCKNIPQEAAQWVVNDAQEKNYGLIVVGEKDVAVLDPDGEVDKIFRQEIAVENLNKAKPLEEVMQQRILQLTPFFSADYEREFMVHVPCCTSGRWHPAFTDVTAKGADKGEGILTMAHYMNLNPEYTMYKIMYGEIGIKNVDYVLDPKDYATLNFHGQYYLDSDKLENYLHFRSDSMQYFYDAYLKKLGAAKPFGKIICKLPGGQKLMGSIIKGTFKKLLNSEHGTKHFIDVNMEDHIDAYWGSRKKWEALPDRASEMNHFTDWNKVVPIDHGYDESKPEEELTLEDLKGAAKFRGGECVSDTMAQGDWRSKLSFRCAFGHVFEASPRLVLEGGHWCPECERKSWNYGARAKVDPFFAQVWNPLHDPDEMREYPKEVSELDV